MQSISNKTYKNKELIKTSNEKWLKRKPKCKKPRRKIRLPAKYDYCSLSELQETFK